MANYLIDGTLLTNIAEAIRSKKGGTTTYTPAEMATTINNLTHSDFTSGTKSITTNGTVNVSQYASVSVNVANETEARASTMTGSPSSTTRITFEFSSALHSAPVGFACIYTASNTKEGIRCVMGRRASTSDPWGTVYTIYYKSSITYATGLVSVTNASRISFILSLSSDTTTKFITGGTYRLLYAY